MRNESGLFNFIENKRHDQKLNGLIGAYVSFSVFSNSVFIDKD